MSGAIMLYVGPLEGMPAPGGLLALAATAGVAGFLAYMAFIPLAEAFLPPDVPAEVIVLLPGVAAAVAVLTVLARLLP